jgi:hypothetical protein
MKKTAPSNRKLLENTKPISCEKNKMTTKKTNIVSSLYCLILKLIKNKVMKDKKINKSFIRNENISKFIGDNRIAKIKKNAESSRNRNLPNIKHPF